MYMYREKKNWRLTSRIIRTSVDGSIEEARLFHMVLFIHVNIVQSFLDLLVAIATLSSQPLFMNLESIFA